MQVHFPALKSYAYVLEADRHTPLTGIAHSGIGGGIGHGIRRGAVGRTIFVESRTGGFGGARLSGIPPDSAQDWHGRKNAGRGR